MKRVSETYNFGSEHLNEMADHIFDLFKDFTPKEQEQVLWMLQGYNLAQQQQNDEQD